MVKVGFQLNIIGDYNDLFKIKFREIITELVELGELLRDMWILKTKTFIDLYIQSYNDTEIPFELFLVGNPQLVLDNVVYATNKGITISQNYNQDIVQKFMTPKITKSIYIDFIRLGLNFPIENKQLMEEAWEVIEEQDAQVQVKSARKI